MEQKSYHHYLVGVLFIAGWYQTGREKKWNHLMLGIKFNQCKECKRAPLFSFNFIHRFKIKSFPRRSIGEEKSCASRYWRWWNEFYGFKKKKKHYVITMYLLRILRLWCSFCSWSSNEVRSIIFFVFVRLIFKNWWLPISFIDEYKIVAVEFFSLVLPKNLLGMLWNNCSIKITNSSELTMVGH